MMATDMQRYRNEHQNLPFLFFLQPDKFLERLALQREELIADIMSHAEPGDAYTWFQAEDFEVCTEIRNKRYCAVVVVPEPQSPLLCRMVGFSMKQDGSCPAYRTIELRADGQYCLCGWTREHVHFNLGDAPARVCELKETMFDELSQADDDEIRALIAWLERHAK